MSSQAVVRAPEKERDQDEADDLWVHTLHMGVIDQGPRHLERDRQTLIQVSSITIGEFAGF